MRALGSLLLGCLLLGLFPSFIEVGEDTLHLLVEGHTLHNADHDGEGEQPDHGCDDCSHCVSCHGQGIPFMVALAAPLPERVAVTNAPARPHVDGMALTEIRARLERPPRA